MRFKSHIRRVLIIDDDPIFVEILRAYFTQRGISEFCVAEDGVRAKELLGGAGDAFDLISCDLNMPEFDGVEFLSYMRQENVTAPIIIVSSALRPVAETAVMLAKSYGLNFQGAVPKPLEPQEIDAALASLLEEGH